MVIASTTTVTNGKPPLAVLSLKADREPLPHSETTQGKVTPIDHGPNSNVDFGAEIRGIDLNNFSDKDFDFISEALHKHKLLVFKEQPSMLTPQQQYRLTSTYVDRLRTRVHF
jgi:hypothetical protein